MIAQLINASKAYDSPAGKMTVLDNCTLEINEGELLFILLSSLTNPAEYKRK